MFCLACLVATNATALGPPPSDLARLAHAMDSADVPQRFEFADTLLAVLQQSYLDELATSDRERPRSDARRAKLRSWRRGTQAMLQRLQDARLLLGEGANVLIRVDPQHQVLLFIDDQPVAFSAPRPGTEQTLERAAITQYCAFNDCALLDIASGDPASNGAAGNWSMRDRQSPVYEMDNHFRCSFRDLAGRKAKQQACTAAAAETAYLMDALRNIVNSGQLIDWQQLTDKRRVNGPDVALYPLCNETALQLTLPHLARLDAATWAALVRQLSEMLQRADLAVTIAHAEQLLAR